MKKYVPPPARTYLASHRVSAYPGHGQRPVQGKSNVAVDRSHPLTDSTMPSTQGTSVRQYVTHVLMADPLLT